MEQWFYYENIFSTWPVWHRSFFSSSSYLLLYVLQTTEQTWMCVAHGVASRGHLTIPLQQVIPEDVLMTVLNKWFCTSHVILGNCFTARRPRCSRRFPLKGWEGSEAQLFRDLCTGLP